MRDILKQSIGLILAWGFWGCALGTEYQATPENYRSFLPQLQAGDRLMLAPGDYRQGLPLKNLHGTAEAPIVVEGAPSNSPRGRTRLLARQGANTVSLVDVQHITIRNLELDGGNQPVDAVKAEGHARYAHFITLEGLYIHDHAANQQNVGISTKCPAVGWVIRGNRIERVGTGMYLGNSNGEAPFVAGLIENNLLLSSLGYNLQIKHQLDRPDALPSNGSRRDTVIRGNFFSKAESSPGPMARPNLLLGHFPLTGEGSEDRYLVHGNLFWNNPSESLFQGEGNIAFYNNVLFTRGPDAIRVQPHNAVPRNVMIAFNTVLARHNGITIRSTQTNPLHRQRVIANLVFSGFPIQGGEAKANLALDFDRAAFFLTDPFQAGAAMDLSPLPGRLPHLDGGVSMFPDLPDIERDFIGRPRPETGPLHPGALGQPGSGPVSKWLEQKHWRLELW